MRPIDQENREPALNGTSVTREQARILSATPVVTATVGVLAAAIVGGTLLTSTVPVWAIAVWFAAILLVVVYDLRLVLSYSEDMDTEACRCWLARNTRSAMAVGVTWGSLAWMLFFEPGEAYATFATMILVGVAGAAATLSAVRTSTAMATVVPALLPLAIYHAADGSALDLAMTAAITAYAALLFKAVEARERALRDTVALHEQTHALANQLQIIADYSYDWEMWFTNDNKLLWVNPSVERITGYAPDECYRMGDDYPLMIIHPDDRERLAAIIQHSQRAGVSGRFEGRIVRKDGTVRWTAGQWQPARDTDDKPAGVRVSVRDITDTMELREELERQASTDALTGLINRRRFLEVCEGELYRSARFARPVALAMFDLDFFKRINDTHGHAVGDLCLRAFVGAIQANIRQTDILARFGGEEFTLLMPETELDAASNLCERLREAVAQTTVTTTKVKVEFTVSIGVTICDPGETSIDAALARADAALYSAKNGGRNRVKVSKPGRLAYGDASGAGKRTKPSATKRAAKIQAGAA